MKQMGINNRIIKYPGKIVFYYLIITVALYFWGPYKWRINNPVLVFGYLIINYIIVYYGYNSYINKIACKSFEDNNTETYYNGILFKVIMFFCISSHIIYSYYVYGGISLDKVLNLAQSYLDNREYTASYNLLTKIITYLWGINYFYLPLGLLNYKKLTTIDKILFIGAILTDLFYWLSIGTMKGLGDIVFMAVIPVYFTAIKNRKQHESIERSIKRRKRIIVILVICFLAVFLYSSFMRTTLRGKSLSVVSPLIARHVYSVDFDWSLSGLNTLIFYVSHGYQGLSYAFQIPFKWTYFLGNSRALTRIVENHFLGSGAISSQIYPARIEEAFGWANGSIWPSCFSWLASDFTFFLIPVLLYYISRKFAQCIYEAMEYNRLSALVLASYLFIFFMYLPCNNQIVQSDRSLFSLLLIIIVYIFEKKGIRFKVHR